MLERIDCRSDSWIEGLAAAAAAEAAAAGVAAAACAGEAAAGVSVGAAADRVRPVPAACLLLPPP